MSIKVNKKFEASHHFESQEQEYQSNKEGIWLFMATELLMFGGLFVAYAIFRGMHPEIFQEGSKLLDTNLGAINTVVLIASSFTMALAVHYTQKGKNKIAFNLVIITFLCAAAFMVVKYFEYTHKFHLGVFPGDNFAYKGMDKNVGMFFGLYFVMTGLHGIHILVGMGLMIWLLIRLKRDDFSEKYYTPVEGVGLYWHVVDIIWIYLFPLMYLI